MSSRALISASLLAIIAIQPVAAQDTAAQFQADEQARRHHYLELSSRVFAGPQSTSAAREQVNSLPPIELEELTERLHDLLVAEITSALALSRQYPRAVISALQEILGDTSLAKWDSQSTNTPLAVPILTGGEQAMAVVYGLLRGGGAIPGSRSYLEFYAIENGRARRVAGIDHDFDGRTFFVSPVPAGLTNQAWFLVWGRAFGDTAARLTVRLYAFDGKTVGTIWQRKDLVRGDVAVTGRAVTLEYDREYHSTERVRETLYVAPDGLR